MVEGIGRRMRGALLAAAAAVLASGCAYRTHTTGMAIDYNDFVAATTNKQTVLNVLRASRREPMHFTSFSEVVGTVRGSGSAGVGLAVNGDSASITRSAAGISRTAAEGATNVAPSLSVAVATGTDFKIAANATDEFYKGILNPVASATVVNYLRQGFPADLLTHLVVGRLEFWVNITRPDGSKTLEWLMTADNRPSSMADIATFDAAVRCRWLDYQPRVAPARTLEAASIGDFGTLTAEQLARVELVADGAGRRSYRLSFPERTDFSLVLSERNADTGECQRIDYDLRMKIDAWLRAQPGSPQPRPTGEAARLHSEGPLAPRSSDMTLGGDDEAERSTTSLRLGKQGFFDELLPAGYTGDLVVDITLRSAQGIIYYLGEYVRPSAPPVLLRQNGTGCPGYCIPILRVLPVSAVPPEERFVEIGYRGASYAVPLSGAVLGEAAGRSSQTIDLVQQLLNLNRSAKDLPATPLVRVYN